MVIRKKIDIPEEAQKWREKPKPSIEALKEEVKKTLSNTSSPESRFRKKQISIRLDQDIVEFFKTHGQFWQREVNQVLRDYMEREK